MFKVDNIRKIDQVFLLLIALLCVIGAVNVFGVTFHEENKVSDEFFSQILFYSFGFVSFFVLSCLDYTKIRRPLAIILIYALSVGLLVLVLFAGVEVFGTRRWISLGFFTLQPSEFAKLSVVLLLATSLASSHTYFREEIFDISLKKNISVKKKLVEFLKSESFIKLTLSFLGMLVIVALVMFQKSLGNSVLIVLGYFLVIFIFLPKNLKFLLYSFVVVFSMLVGFRLITLEAMGFNGVKLYGIDVFLVLGLGVLVILLAKIFQLNLFFSLVFLIVPLFSYSALRFGYENILHDYQRQRLETYIAPSDDQKLSEDWNRQQSINAIASAKFLGKGLLKGSVVNNDYLPFAHTDFAFAGFVEQFGFVGATLILLLYFFLLYKISSIAMIIRDEYGVVLTIGVGVMILLNVVQHVGMNLGVLPITGVPLPLISVGGSNILTVFIGLGLIQSALIYSTEQSNEVVNLVK